MTQQRETTLFAHLAPEAVGKPYLGDPTVVDALVRGYVMGMWNRVIEAAEGTITRQEAAAEDQKAAQVFMRVIAGRDPGYVPLGGWNANEVGGLQGFIRKALDMVANDAMLARDPYEALAAYLMARTYHTLRSAGQLSEGELRDQLDGILDDGNRILLGLPSSQDLEDATPDLPEGAV